MLLKSNVTHPIIYIFLCPDPQVLPSLGIFLYTGFKNNIFYKKNKKNYTVYIHLGLGDLVSPNLGRLKCKRKDGAEDEV